MRFYLNELSLDGLPEEPNRLETYVRLFIKRCIILKKIGFTELRSFVYPLDIEIAPGYLLASWIKDRAKGNRELKSRFKSLSLNAPLFDNTEDRWIEISEWSTFKYNGREARGIGAAYIASSMVVSFPTNSDWQSSDITPIEYEYYDTVLNDINKEEVSVRNISSFRHLHLNKQHSLEQYKLHRKLDDWIPINNILPNAALTNDLLKINKFYGYFQTLNPQNKIAVALSTGKKVAELNNYLYDMRLSNLNTTSAYIRKIYTSDNKRGRKTYLSIDIEKAAFEVCDHQGVHQKEILFNGNENGGQQLDHSIKLK